MDLGYNRSNVVALTAPRGTGDDVLKQRLETLPGIVSTGRIDALPGPNFWRFELIREGRDRSENFPASRFAVDEDALKTLEIGVGRGRGFSRDLSADSQDGIIVNETLVRKFGYEEPIGTVLRYYDENNNNSITSRKIVGVIRDFHYLTARQPSEPMIFLLNPRSGYLVAWPAAYFAAKNWLADFTFRVPFQAWTFGLASLATLLVALLTVSVQSIRAIRANPANSLRDAG